MPNPVIHWQIITPQPDAAASFYQKLFSWRISAANPMGYRQVATDADRGIQGGIWPAPPGKPSFVQLHIEVADLDATVERATKLGATVLMPKSVLPEGDALAVLLDPCGVAFVLCTFRPR